MAKGLTVVIPTINDEKTLDPLLESLSAQNFLYPLEVIVVNNSKTKEKINLNKFNLDLKQIFSNPGVNTARNAGLKEAKNEIILFLDDDCRLIHPATLATHHKRHRLDLELFALGGGYQIPKQAHFFSQLYNQMQMSWLYGNLIENTSWQTRCLIGGHFSIKKSLAVGHDIYFNEAILYGGSEVSFFERAYLLKLKMWLMDFKVLHLTNESFFSLHRKIYKQGKNHCFEFDRSKNIVDLQKIEIFFDLFKSYFNLLYWWSAYQNQGIIKDFFKHKFLDLQFFISKRRLILREKLLQTLKKR